LDYFCRKLVLLGYPENIGLKQGSIEREFLGEGIMKPFDELPKTLKKTLRYINQDVKSVEMLEQIENTLNHYIKKRKIELKKDTN